MIASVSRPRRPASPTWSTTMSAPASARVGVRQSRCHLLKLFRPRAQNLLFVEEAAPARGPARTGSRPSAATSAHRRSTLATCGTERWSAAYAGNGLEGQRNPTGVSDPSRPELAHLVRRSAQTGSPVAIAREAGTSSSSRRHAPPRASRRRSRCSPPSRQRSPLARTTQRTLRRRRPRRAHSRGRSRSPLLPSTPERPP